MPRATFDTSIAARAARERLQLRHQCYWRGLSAGAALAYRKGARGGSWVVRMADATAGGGYRQKAIGLSDDQLEADGTKVLDYRQAESAAREWIARHNRIAAGREPEPSVRGTIHDTVKDATADDMANDEAQSGKSSSQIRIDCLFQR